MKSFQLKSSTRLQAQRGAQEHQQREARPLITQRTQLIINLEMVARLILMDQDQTANCGLEEARGKQIKARFLIKNKLAVTSSLKSHTKAQVRIPQARSQISREGLAPESKK